MSECESVCVCVCVCVCVSEQQQLLTSVPRFVNITLNVIIFFFTASVNDTACTPSCENGGTCLAEPTGTRCYCPEIYTGKNCEKRRGTNTLLLSLLFCYFIVIVVKKN